MFDSLLTFDNQLFLFIYHLPHPFLLVLIMEFLSLVGYFGIVWMVLGYVHKRFKKVFIALLLVFVIVDVLLKFTFARVRPYPSMLDNIFPWESYSFPSGHAAASFAAAFILTRFKKQSKKSPQYISYQYINILIWSLAVLISFSRVYLGRHYPLDIVAGGIIGWGIGYAVNKLT